MLLDHILQGLMYPFLFLSMYFQIFLLTSFFENKKKIKTEELFELGVVDVLAEKNEGELAVYEFVRKESKQRNGTFALRAAREIAQPIVYDELVRIAELWVDAALHLETKDLRMMERLVARQNTKSVATTPLLSTQISA